MSSGAPTPRARHPRVPAPPVTAEGLREGDPLVLAAIVQDRGPDVLAYAEAVAPEGEALRMAAAVFAALRISALSSHEHELDVAAELLSATRRTAARQAENPFRPGEHPRPERRTTVCDRFPRLLTTWADQRLPREDAERLIDHVEGCPDCAALNVAFDRAETGFREGPTPTLDPVGVGALVTAMALARTG